MNTNPQCPEAVTAFVATSVYTDEPYNVTRALLLMVILTATRSGEAEGMRWAEIDFHKRVWTIPAERNES